MRYQVDPTDQTQEKGQKTLFWLFGSFKNAFFLIFEWSSMSHIMAKLLRPFSIVKICNIKLILWTKLKKMANNWMDHSKRPTRRTKKISNVNQNFFGHAVFAGFSKKGCSIIKSGFRKIPYRGFPSKSAQSWKMAVFGLTSWIFEWSRFFPGKPPCTFHVLIELNVHAKKLRNR